MSYLDLIQKEEAPESVPAPVIFAATDMTTVIRNGCPPDQDTVTENAKRYRRLTPEYWAWFNHKYHLMENALTRKKISETAFAEILNRISTLYNHAIALYGKETLDEAVRTTDVRKLDELLKRENAAASGNSGNGGSHQSTPSLVVEREQVVPDAPKKRRPQDNPAAAKVDAIRDRATDLGWTRDQLYRTDGVAYRDWGLVRFLDPDDEIGEITLQRIEIVNRKTGKSLYFHNHRVDQPWMRKSSEAGVQHGS